MKVISLICHLARSISGRVKTILVVACLVCNSLASAQDFSPLPTLVAWEDDFSLPPQDGNGWSIFNPSADSRLVYVSATGDDATAETYIPSDVVIGGDPRKPVGSVKPYASIDAAVVQIRNGFADWVLLKRGDTFIRTSRLEFRKQGRSVTERIMLTSYGASETRPLLKTGIHTGIRLFRDAQNVAIVGLKFFAHQRTLEKAPLDFVGLDNVGFSAGFRIFSSDPGVSGILLEDNVFDSYSNNLIEGSGPPATDIIIRRNQVLDNWDPDAHAQGVFISDASILIEENLFQHNGWLIQSFEPTQSALEGQATFFNHNIYVTDVDNSIIRRNIISQASSIGIKFAANSKDSVDVINTENILVEDNLFLEGELGISLGGNTDRGTGFRFRNIHVTNNVMVSLGRSDPTDRRVALGLDANDWDGGIVSGNYFMNYEGANLLGGLRFIEFAQNVQVVDNFFYNITSDSTGLSYVLTLADGFKTNFEFKRNQIQSPFETGTVPMRLLTTEDAIGLDFAENVWFSTLTSPFTVNTSNNFKALADLDGGPSESSLLVNDNHTALQYLEGTRTVESYNVSLGGANTLEDFIEEAKKQSIFNWRDNYTAVELNRYMRHGLCLGGQPVCSVPNAPLSVTAVALE